MWDDGHIELQGNQIHYRRTGVGSKLLIAFHGYANNAEMFDGFEQNLQEYTIISIDLPYHGKTGWHDDRPLEVSDLNTIARRLMEDMRVNEFSLLGYSMGARACLCIVEQIPQCVDAVLLAAPDGLVPNPLYHFVTKNGVGKWLFKDFLSKPERYDLLINAARNLKIVSEARYKFAMQNMNSVWKRMQLLHIWPNMSRIIPDMKKLQTVLGQYNIPVHVFIGVHDRVIPVKYGKRFVKKIKTAKLHVVEKGHWLFDADTISKMAACLD
jgi:pimeloyl-ACP methyl ester carboxylesterase